MKALYQKKTAGLIAMIAAAATNGLAANAIAQEFNDRGQRLNATNGTKPFKATGSRITDKNWFRTVESGDYDAGYVWVRFDANASHQTRDAIDEAAGAIGVDYESTSVDGLFRVTVKPGTEIAVINAYLDFDEVLYAEPNYRTHVKETPNDPQYDSQADAFNLAKFPRIWDAWTGDPDFKIGILDTGVKLDHRDLVDNLWTNPVDVRFDANGDGCPGICGVDDDGDGLIDEDPFFGFPSHDDDENGYADDFHGWNTASNDGFPDPCREHIDIGVFSGPIDHGTHVAGTFGARGDNDVDVTGASWRASIVPVTGTVCVLSNTVAGFDYLNSTGIRVSNHSHGNTEFEQSWYDAVEQGIQTGHLYVVAAGNDGEDIDAPGTTPSYPAEFDLPNVITVAAHDTSLIPDLSFFSSYGAVSVDLAAPGRGIFSTSFDDDMQDNIESKRGTSMAAPHVTGAVALIMQSQPYVRWQDVKERLLTSVIPNDTLEGKTVTGGRLNAARAFATFVEPGGCGLIPDGSFIDPYCEMNHALDDVATGGTLMLKAGASVSWTGTISQNVYIDAWNGSGTIGQ